MPAAGKKRRRRQRHPLGAIWRILAHSARGSRRFELYSADYPGHYMVRDLPSNRLRRVDLPIPSNDRVGFRTILDEVVLSFGGGSIHLEQMDTRSWFLGIGEEKVIITIDKDGRPVIGQWYR